MDALKETKTNRNQKNEKNEMGKGERKCRI